MHRSFLFATAFALVTSAATAHVSFETGQAPVGSTFKAILRIPHGCEGKATDSVRIKIPEGIIAVKPMPKPGWKIEKVVARYTAEYELHGKKVNEGITELAWSGGKLADDEYDEFVFRVNLSQNLPVGEMIYFPVVQACGDATLEWTQTPAKGQSAHDLELPAPGLELLHEDHMGH